MKKIMTLIMIMVILSVVTGCTATANSLGNDDNIVYENDDKTVRLEIGMKTSSNGRLYILENETVKSFVIDYFIPREMISVFLNAPELEDSRFVLDVSFEKVNYFKLNYNVMILKGDTDKVENPDHDIFTNFDVTLNRVYDEEVSPLNYFNNNWKSVDNEIILVNNDLSAFYSGVVYGTIGEERVWISFATDSFTIWSREDLKMKLSGGYKTEGLNIILEPFQWYTDYPSSIILNFIDPNDA